MTSEKDIKLLLEVARIAGWTEVREKDAREASFNTHGFGADYVGHSPNFSDGVYRDVPDFLNDIDTCIMVLRRLFPDDQLPEKKQRLPPYWSIHSDGVSIWQYPEHRGPLAHVSDEGQGLAQAACELIVKWVAGNLP